MTQDPLRNSSLDETLGFITNDDRNGGMFMLDVRGAAVDTRSMDEAAYRLTAMDRRARGKGSSIENQTTSVQIGHTRPGY